MRLFQPEQFSEICEKTARLPRQRNTIGTLSEKTLHAVLKQYYEPLADMHEMKIGGYIADIINEDGVLEIQTGSFTGLKKKLECFLPVTNVTIICPVVHHKWINWLEPETGEIVSKRKSPKAGLASDACYQLCSILPYLTNPKLTVCLTLVDVEEYRALDGWSKSRKRGSHRVDQIPVKLVGEVLLHSRKDYLRLLPELPDGPFTAVSLASVLNRSVKRTRPLITVLETVGAVRRAGKEGRRILYELYDGLEDENL